MPDITGQPAVPDITGQPAWVVIILAVLALASTVGVAWLNRTRKSAIEDPPPQATLTEGGKDTAVVAIQSALDHLARIAEREAAESAEARRETASLRDALEVMRRDLTAALARAQTAEANLEACRAHARILTDEAFRRGEQ